MIKNHYSLIIAISLFAVACLPLKTSRSDLDGATAEELVNEHGDPSPRYDLLVEESQPVTSANEKNQEDAEEGSEESPESNISETSEDEIFTTSIRISVVITRDGTFEGVPEGLDTAFNDIAVDYSGLGPSMDNGDRVYSALARYISGDLTVSEPTSLEPVFVEEGQQAPQLYQGRRQTFFFNLLEKKEESTEAGVKRLILRGEGPAVAGLGAFTIYTIQLLLGDMTSPALSELLAEAIQRDDVVISGGHFVPENDTQHRPYYQNAITNAAANMPAAKTYMALFFLGCMSETFEDEVLDAFGGHSLEIVTAAMRGLNNYNYIASQVARILEGFHKGETWATLMTETSTAGKGSLDQFARIEGADNADRSDDGVIVVRSTDAQNSLFKAEGKKHYDRVLTQELEKCEVDQHTNSSNHNSKHDPALPPSGRSLGFVYIANDLT